MQVSLIFCVTFITIVVVSTSSQVGIDFLHHSKCFEEYFHQVTFINRNYEESFSACYDVNNVNRQPAHQLDLEAEIEKYKQTSREACIDLRACKCITDITEFFHCYSKQAELNVHKYFIIHLNASSVAIELNDKYDQEEKEILRCQLAAKREHFLISFAAFKQHLTCLNGF